MLGDILTTATGLKITTELVDKSIITVLNEVPHVYSNYSRDPVRSTVTPVKGQYIDYSSDAFRVIPYKYSLIKNNQIMSTLFCLNAFAEGLEYNGIN